MQILPILSPGTYCALCDGRVLWACGHAAGAAAAAAAGRGVLGASTSWAWVFWLVAYLVILLHAGFGSACTMALGTAAGNWAAATSHLARVWLARALSAHAQPLRVLTACPCGHAPSPQGRMRLGAWGLKAPPQTPCLLAHALLLTWAPLCAGSRGARGHDARPSARGAPVPSSSGAGHPAPGCHAAQLLCMEHRHTPLEACLFGRRRSPHAGPACACAAINVGSLRGHVIA